MRAHVVAALCSIALAMTACSSAPPVAVPDPSAGEETLKRPTRAPDPGEEPRTIDRTPGTIEVLARDAQGRTRSGVTVRYSGPDEEGTIRTGTDGIGRERVPPGTYRIDPLTGCRGRLEVTSISDGGRLGVPAGQTVRLSLQVEARRRFVPSAPVSWSPEPSWPSGDEVRFSFSLFDRCKNVEAPDTHFRDLRYRASGNIALGDTDPQEVGEDATTTIRFRCTAPGDAQIWLEDPEVPSDRTDLLALRPPFNPDTPWCG